MFTYNHNFYTKITYIIRIFVHQEKNGSLFLYEYWYKILKKFYISRFMNNFILQKPEIRKQELWTCLALIGINIIWGKKNEQKSKVSGTDEYFWIFFFMKFYFRTCKNVGIFRWNYKRSVREIGPWKCLIYSTWALTFYFILSVWPLIAIQARLHEIPFFRGP